MKEAIEQILAELEALKCSSEKEVEEARIRFLGKKGSVTRLFEEFRTVAPELKREFGQKLNLLKKQRPSASNRSRKASARRPAPPLPATT